MVLATLILYFLFIPCLAHAVTCIGAAAGGAWTANGSWTGCSGAGGLGPPLASDDVTLVAATGDMTIGTGAVARSVNLTGYTHTLTHTAGVTLTIGDGTAGLANVALEFPASGWTYTLGNATTSAIAFVSTSATQQTVNFNGKTTGNTTFNAGSNGSWQYTGSQTTTGAITLTQGALDTNGQTITTADFGIDGPLIRSLTLGATALTVTAVGGFHIVDGTGLTLSAASSTITISGTSTFKGAGFTYGTVAMTACNVITVSGANTFGTFTRTGTASKACSIYFDNNQIITGTLTLNGNSPINRLFVASSTLGLPVTITAGAVAATYVDLRDITGAGTAWNLSAITGNSGDCGGNTNITFTTPTTQTSTGTASFAWSTHGWTTHVPLCQDHVAIPNAFIASRVVTLDMPRAGADITWTATGNPAWTVSIFTQVYGSVTMVAGMTMTGTAGISFQGRSPMVVTSAGVTWTNPLYVEAFETSVSLGDAMTSSHKLSVVVGTWNDAGFASTFLNLASSFSSTRNIIQTGAMTLTGSGAVVAVTGPGLTMTATGSSLTLSDTSASASSFAGGDQTGFGTLIIAGGGTGILDITGSNTFAGMTIGAPKTVRFTAATTTTLLAAPTCTGTLGNVITISSITAATHTLSLQHGPVSCDFLNLTNSVATGLASWYAGANSTNSGGNGGWIFTAPPLEGVGTGGKIFLSGSGFFRP